MFTIKSKSRWWIGNATPIMMDPVRMHPAMWSQHTRSPGITEPPLCFGQFETHIDAERWLFQHGFLLTYKADDYEYSVPEQPQVNVLFFGGEECYYRMLVDVVRLKPDMQPRELPTIVNDVPFSPELE